LSVLQNFPMVSQLTSVTGDNKPSENRLYDCVAASIDAACRYLLNKSEDSVFNPDSFKDQAYGDTWIGGTAAIKYIAFCKSLGVNLYPVQGSPQKLVALAHGYLAQEKPVIFTMPDSYSSDPNMTHVCVFYADGPGYLVAMDPFPLPGVNSGHPDRRTDAEWMNVLLFNEVWITERIDDMPPPITITNPAVAVYFVQTGPTSWHCAKTGKVIQGAILSYYQTCGATALHGLLDLGLPVSNEIPLDGKGNVKQFYERGVVFYDPGKIYDSPPGSGPVYHAHLYSGAGQDPEIADLQKQLAILQKMPQAPQMDADLQQIYAIAEKYK